MIPFRILTSGHQREHAVEPALFCRVVEWQAAVAVGDVHLRTGSYEQIQTLGAPGNTVQPDCKVHGCKVLSVARSIFVRSHLESASIML